MIAFLSKRFIKNYKQYDHPDVRASYGILCGSVGILLNLLLFVMKFLAGFMSHSIAITADAFNNLSDAGSSLITLFGFRLGKAAPDLDHPYGHGRMEYLAGLFVSMLILYMSFELITSSVNRIINPEATTYSTLTFCILIVSILIKFYMYLFNGKYSKKIASSALKAASMDSLSDVLSTFAILVCTLLSHFLNLHLEGYFGILVGLFILYAGIQATKDTISPLLGKAPTEEIVSRIKEIVLSQEGVLGIHDLMVHDYGPGRQFISLHAEVPADGDMLEFHDTIDQLERSLGQELNCIAVIHMDPICINDAETNAYKQQIEMYLHTLSDKLSVHDFRIVKGTTHTNLIFDVFSPYDCPVSDKELLSNLHNYIRSLEGDIRGVITLDKI